MLPDLRKDVIAAVLLLACVLSRPASAAPTVVLTWEHMSGAIGYEVEIANDVDFTERVVESTTPAPRYEWPALPERTFYWRVRSLHSFGRRGQWSVVKTIPRAVWPVTLEQPAPDQEVICAEGCTLVLGFRTSPALAEYHVEVAADSAFASLLLDVRTRSGSVDWAPPHVGYFYWRVSATDIAGRPVGPSASWRFTVRSPPRPPRVADPVPTPVAVAVLGSSGTTTLALHDAASAAQDTRRRTADMPEAGRWMLSAGAGWRSNFARASGATPVIGIAQELTDGGVSGGLTASTFRVSSVQPDGTRARAEVAEAALHVAIAREWRGQRVGLHAGPVLQVVRARVGPADELGVTSATGVGAWIEGRLGRGRWFAGFDVRAGRWDGRYSRLSTGGVLLSTGVRFGG